MSRIKKIYPSLVPVLAWSQVEERDLEDLKRAAPDLIRLENVSTGTGAEIFRGCVAYLGNDSGPMHLAAAVGISCVAVFSARAPKGEWYPLGLNHLPLEANVFCRDCRLIECKVHGLRCLTDISVDSVFQDFEKAVGSRGV